tara:strand:- start:639 stop:764 length:126 start_codon:yes stop_codon:yes gene_type:complete
MSAEANILQLMLLKVPEGLARAPIPIPFCHDEGHGNQDMRP